MRVTDYVSNFIYNELNVDTVFMVSGGGSIFLSDGLYKNKNIKVICNHHEQASAMGASGYARDRNDFGVALFTTGCGGTNAITGLLGAYQDSIPVVFISGQVKSSLCSRNYTESFRQLGVQEVDIINIVEDLTKYSVMITSIDDVRYELEKAKYLAKSGRPGPVWIDIPADIQSAEILDIDSLKTYIAEDVEKEELILTTSELDEIGTLLQEAERPVVIAGNGVRLSNTADSLLSFLEEYSIPLVTPYLGVDLISTYHPLHMGTIGCKGSRAGNFCVQNSDLIIVLGSRLDISAIGYEPTNFAREAKKIVIDVDAIEHKKPLVSIDHFYHANLKQALPALLTLNKLSYSTWAEKAKEWKTLWPVCSPEYSTDDTLGINMYLSVDRITRLMPTHSTVISDAGSAFYITSQVGNFSETQRYVTSGAQAEMGFTVPAAIGVAANNDSSYTTVGITGDGSLQMNIQEIQTIIHNNLNIKLFILNNDGYLSIKASQENLFEGRIIGSDAESGVSFPCIEKISNAYGVKYIRIDKISELDQSIQDCFNSNGPVICEIISPKSQGVVPCTKTVKRDDGTLFSKPMEDMFPFLSRDEFEKHMIIKPIRDDK